MANTDKITESIQRYGAAWNHTDPEQRRALLDGAFATSGVFSDPLSYVEGREALLAHIQEFHDTKPGCSFTFDGDINVVRSHHRFRWQLLTPDGAVALTATNFGESDEAGALTLMVDFFDQR